MFVIIKNLPTSVSIKYIRDWLDQIVAKRNLFRSNDNVYSIKVLKRVFRDQRLPEFHALVHVSSEQAGKRLIRSCEKLRHEPTIHLMSFGDSEKISIAEYVTRHHGRDRRSVSALSQVNYSDVRSTDRRRLDSKLLTVSELSGNDKMTAKETMSQWTLTDNFSERQLSLQTIQSNSSSKVVVFHGYRLER